MNVFNTGGVFTPTAFITCAKRMGAQWAWGH